MIRFCDKELWVMRQEECDRAKLRKFFLDGHMDDIVQLVDMDDNYIGTISFQGLISCESMEDALITAQVEAGDEMWGTLCALLNKAPSQYIPIFVGGGYTGVRVCV